MKVLIAGDFCPNHRVSKLVDSGSYGEIFSEVKSVAESADISIVNFETCLNEHEAKPIEKQGPNLCTTGKAVDAVKYIGFKAVTLANNHFYDYGDQGVGDTIAALDKAGINHVGGGKNLAEAEKVLYVTSGNETIAIVNCCEHEFSIASDTSGGANPLNPIRQYYAIKEARTKADYVIVIVHGGIEHFQLPSLRMKETYRFFIDAGADAVINHHQHCFSGYEIYNGKPICYGLGNFCFDWPEKRGDVWYEGFMASLNLSKDKTILALIPYSQCMDSPSVKLLNERESERFNERVQELNSIIGDDNRLEKELDVFYRKGSNHYRVLFEPYKDKYTRALCKRGLLPSFIDKDKRIGLLNYLICESHLERLIASLKSDRYE